MDRATKKLGQKVKRLRIQRMMSQATLALRAGVTRGYVSRLEIGRHDPALSTLRKLARALRVKLADLLE
jgi:transcriptional regulator with XRE-family HTH domain